MSSSDPNAADSMGADGRRALRIAAVYLVVGLAWILASDYAVNLAFDGPPGLTRMQSLKGYAFVTLTCVLLYLLARREFQALNQAQARLAGANQELARLAAFPRLSPHPIVELSGAGDVTYANDAARQAVSELGASSVTVLLPGNGRNIAHRSLARGGRIPDVEHRVKGHVLRWSFFPEPDSNVVYGYGRDCTEEVSLGARLVEAEKLEAVGRLTAGVAHDFNNLLNAVRLGSQVIESDGEATEAIRESARAMRAAADQAAALVRRLDAFRRTRPAELRRVDLNDEVRGFSPLARLVVRPVVAVSVNTSDEPLPVLADPTQLGRVLMNLVVNANDAIGEEGRIEITTGRVAEAGGAMATLRVTDTGSGIAADVLPHVFEPFFTTKADKGTGLGLSTVREVVTLHGGRIEVESSPGEGTTFVVTWPLAETADLSSCR